jgi:hypothetical protein
MKTASELRVYIYVVCEASPVQMSPNHYKIQWIRAARFSEMLRFGLDFGVAKIMFLCVLALWRAQRLPTTRAAQARGERQRARRGQMRDTQHESFQSASQATKV